MRCSEVNFHKQFRVSDCSVSFSNEAIVLEYYFDL